MTTASIPFKLEQFASGRFAVLAENGSRMGSIIGGGTGSHASWGAEIGSKVLGYFATKPKAATAILEARGVKGLYAQMKAIVEGPDSILESYKDDFYKVDKEVMEGWKCATGMLWVVRKNGTNLVQLDSPFTEREGLAILDALNPTLTGQGWQLWHVDITDLKVKSITEAAARDLVRRKPIYDVQDTFITCWGKTIAEIKTKQVQSRRYELTSALEIHCEREPDEKTLAILPRCGFHYLQKQQRSMFATAASMSVYFGKKRLFHWDHPSNRPAD
jgi:hypothetical protein